MPHEQLLKKLISLGLTGYEAKVYLAMMGRNSLTASEVSRLSGVPRQRTYDVLNSLHLKGLCVEVPGNVIRYHASKSKDALLGMLVDRNREFQRKLEGQRDIAVNLGNELSVLSRKEEDAGDPNGSLQVFLHPNQMLRKYDELLLEAEEEIICTARRPYIQAMAEKTYEKVKGGVNVRFLIDEEILDKEPRMIEAIFSLYGNNEHRFMDGIPLKFSVFDKKKTLLFLTNENGGGVMAVVIENPGLAQSLSMLFETLWVKGTPSSMRREDVERAIGEAKA